MKWLKARFSEPSSYAGIGIMLQAGLQLAATGGADPSAWAVLVPALIAFIKKG